MAAGQQLVDGGAQLRLIADAGPLRLMLDVAFALVLAGNDDGQAVLPQEPGGQNARHAAAQHHRITAVAAFQRGMHR